VTPTPTPTPVPTAPQFNKNAKSITDPNSIWVVVNKLRPLNPKTYSPPDIVTVPVAHNNPAQMRKVAADALVAMFAAGKNAGAGSMQVQSSWRPYSTQVSVYNGWVASLGKQQADRQSARPGYSEHQTGLAVDISPVPLRCALAACFGTTSQGKWLAANAWKYGYLLRYPADKTKITGYEYEPWHFRYIGVALSTEMHKEGVKTLEEFFGLPAAPDYAK
jgi:D-alanyl-D-alanine carboxypeptidase